MPASTNHIQTNLDRIEKAKHPELVRLLRESRKEVQHRLAENGLKPSEVKDPSMWSRATWALILERSESAGVSTELPGSRGREARRAARIAAGLPVRRTKAQKLADDAARPAEEETMDSDPAEFEDDNDEQDNQ